MRGISSSHQTFIIVLAALQSSIFDHAAAPVNESAADDRLDEAMSAFAHDARAFQREQGRTHSLIFRKVD